MFYIDTHFHSLHMQDKGIDIHELFKALNLEGFAGGIDAGTHYSDISIRVELLKGYPGIYCSGGIHPGSAAREPLDTLLSGLETVMAAAESQTIRFIGECGIDAYRSSGTLDQQSIILEEQLKLANTLKLPVIIHCRDGEEVLSRLFSKIQPEFGGIMHCFSSTIHFAQEMQEAGFLISFAGNITYRKNHDLRQVMRQVHLENLLFETDSPYLPPEPKRGRTNHPGLIMHTYKFAAAQLGISTSELADTCIRNFKRLTGEDYLTSSLHSG